ncbi:pantoate--beta-alanine ligase [Paenibacillus sp. GCM10023252]|uniref:pantoate--beta-alanine ligase n=1 Tax=Paenibacillus sp. GCM10023252 TaxID=3252649 RepID=UPI0036231553
MILCRTLTELSEQLTKLKHNCSNRSNGSNGSVGFVPTMGYLHEGHASLLRRSRAENDISVLSIFVNPLQFGPNEDLDRYPRDEKRDLALAEECQVDLVFLPSTEEMYPKKPLTRVLVSGLTSKLCGASRPGHFDGVGMVVGKLFHLIGPTRAYFGMKDAQQVAVIQQMVDDLNYPVEIVPCPIVREPDGLALSSRNVYLSAEERAEAVVLSQTLQAAAQWIQEDGMTAEALLERVRQQISNAHHADIDYAELYTYPSLEEVPAAAPILLQSDKLILALAVKFGSTRLIDNRLLYPNEVINHA